MTRRIAWLLALGLIVLAIPSLRADDKAGLQGMWMVEKAIENGTEIPAKERQKLKVEFQGNKILMHDGDMADKNTFAIGKDKSLKALDVLIEKKDERPIMGIYELKGDNLKICFAKQGDKRPTEFASTKASGSLLLELKRVKK